MALDLFNNLYGGAKWDVGVAINRSNALPLDRNSIFPSYELAVAYAAKNAEGMAAELTRLGLADVSINNNAYAGQVLAVVTETETTIYYIDAAGLLQEVGGKVGVDNISIKADEDGNLFIAGFKDADALTLPQKQADGSILWVPISSIVEGDGNTITEVAAADKSIDVAVTESSDSSIKYDVKVNISSAADNQLSLDATGLYVAKPAEYDDSEIRGLLDEKADVSALGSYYTKTEIDDKGFLTEHQDISGLATKEELTTGLAGKVDNSSFETLSSEVAKKALASDLQDEITRAKQAEGALADRVTAVETLVNGTDEDTMDSIAELIDYVKEHGTEVTQMQGDIEQNASDISTLSGKVDTNASGLAQEILDREGGDSALSNRIDALQEQVNGIQIPDVPVQSVNGKTGAVVITAEELGAITEHQDISGKLDVEVYNNDKLTFATKGEVTTAVETLEGSISGVVGSVETVSGRVDAVEGRLDTIEGKLPTDTIATTTDITNAITESEEKIAKDVADLYYNKGETDSLIQTVRNEIPSVLIKSVDSAVFGVSAEGQLNLNSVDESKVTGLQKITSVKNVEGEFVDTLSNATLEDILVLASYDDATGSGQAGLMSVADKEKLSALIIGEGGIEVSGKVSVDNVNGLPTYLNKKIDKVEFADVEVAGMVSSGTGLAQVNTYQLPLITSAQVQEINVNKLVQTEGDELILNGGNATKTSA